jgi:hypothetical protein
MKIRNRSSSNAEDAGRLVAEVLGFMETLSTVQNSSFQ